MWSPCLNIWWAGCLHPSASPQAAPAECLHRPKRHNGWLLAVCVGCLWLSFQELFGVRPISIPKLQAWNETPLEKHIFGLDKFLQFQPPWWSLSVCTGPTGVYFVVHNECSEFDKYSSICWALCFRKIMTDMFSGHCNSHPSLDARSNRTQSVS